eukprot:Clim_evm113s109 gene=Clim_evmTU113s109
MDGRNTPRDGNGDATTALMNNERKFPFQEWKREMISAGLVPAELNTKSSIKKWLKNQWFAIHKAQWRHEERQRRKDNKRKYHELMEDQAVKSTGDGDKRDSEEPLAFGPGRKRKRQFMHMADSPNKTSVVLDLMAVHVMTDSETSKVLSQVSRCYSINRRMEQPFQYHVTSLETVKNKLPQNYVNWDCQKHDADYLDVFRDRKQNIIYLTSDSPNVLQEFNPEDVLIIGGLVDHNRLKDYTVRHANEVGVKTARLPIRENLTYPLREVLSIPHVYDILAHFQKSRDWKQALEAGIPPRNLERAESQAAFMKQKQEDAAAKRAAKEAKKATDQLIVD